MIRSFLSRAARRYFGISAALLFSMTHLAGAKDPDFGGPKQFDLFCRGRSERVLDSYIFVPMAGTGRVEPKIETVHNHLVIDMKSMQYLEEGQYHPQKIPLHKDFLLYFRNDWSSLLWTINLNTYRSISVKHDDDGALYIEKMKCRLAKFSGFPFVPSSPEEVREMLKRQK